MNDGDPARPGPADGSGSGSQQDGMPRWVKGFVIAGVVVALLVVLVLVFAGGGHGPGRHLPDGAGAETGTPAGRTPPMDHG